MKKKFRVLLFLLLFFALCLYFWWNQAARPVNSTDKTVKIFVIKKGEPVRSIAERLQKDGLIRSAVAFFLLARFGGIGDNIQAGDFWLNPAMDLKTLAYSLTHGTTDIWITIPEGWRSEEIATKITQQLAIPESEFLKAAKVGYMFPDTYLISKEATAGAIVELLLNNFDKKIQQEGLSGKKKKGLTLNEIVIIASLIEREAKFAADRPLVASVILNRLNLGMKLDIDATVQYALGYQSKEKTWWKKNLTVEDLEIDSPYNTYINPGLPPEPISNPGILAIKAVIEAPDTNYLYYISDQSGKIHLAKDIDEHNQNIAKYLNK